MSPALWHYTCEHGRSGLGKSGLLIPAISQPGVDPTLVPVDHRWLLELSWATDLDAPVIASLGLTNLTIRCQRWRHRYRVLDAEKFEPWHRFARRLDYSERALVEAADGAMPAHWWVTSEPARVVFDPQEQVA